MDCIYFKGDRPCKPYWEQNLYKENFKCSKECNFYQKIVLRILLIKIDAIGDVLRTTPLAEGIKKKFPHCQLTWLVAEEALPLIKNNPFIDRILTYTPNNLNALMCEYFDILINLDKDKKATFLANKIKSKNKRGFLLSKFGTPFPINKGAERFYKIALDNWGEKTFNTKSFQEMIFEIAEIPFNNEKLFLKLDESDLKFAERFRKKLGKKKVVGINTGCGSVYPHKKWTKEAILNLIKKLKLMKIEVILFGGTNEMELNNELEKKTGAINSGNKNSLTEFAALINICDVIVTGDTSGLHIAIALEKQVIALFGPTPNQEIKINSGKKILGKVPCLNCYDQFPCLMEEQGKKNCMQTITSEEVLNAILEILK